MDNIILKVCTKVLFTPIILFGLYVQFHGDFGPGGGFQAGVIVAAAFILYAIVFSIKDCQKIMPPKLTRIFTIRLSVVILLVALTTIIITMFIGTVTVPQGSAPLHIHAFASSMLRRIRWFIAVLCKTRTTNALMVCGNLTARIA